MQICETCKTCLHALSAIWRAVPALPYTLKKTDGQSVLKKTDVPYVAYLPYAAKKDAPFVPYMLKELTCHTIQTPNSSCPVR